MIDARGPAAEGSETSQQSPEKVSRNGQMPILNAPQRDAIHHRQPQVASLSFRQSTFQRKVSKKITLLQSNLRV